MIPHRCPVCQGRGALPVGFYNTGETGTSTTTADEVCRACGGKGILWDSPDFNFDTPLDAAQKLKEKGMIP